MQGNRQTETGRGRGTRGLRSLALALALVLAAGGSLLFPTRPALAAGDPFTIAAYPIEGRAANAVAAKKQAIADGQTAALRSLFKRLVPVTAYPRLKQIPEVNAAEYVGGISVRGEQNSSTEYFASLDFRFSAEAVESLLRQNGVPFIREQAPVVTLLPVEVGADGSVAAAAKQWSGIWSALDLENALSPLTVSSWRATLHPDVLAGLNEGDASRGIRIVSSEYGVQRVIVAQASVDRSDNRLNVRIAGEDAVGPINWARSYRIYDGDVAFAMELAAVISLGVIEGRWKAAKARASGGLAALSQPAAPLRLEVQFSSARDWYDMQQAIGGLDGVSNYRVEAVSARSAQVSLSYPGGGYALANVLARQGYQVTEAGDRWLVQQRY